MHVYSQTRVIRLHASRLFKLHPCGCHTLLTKWLLQQKQMRDATMGCHLDEIMGKTRWYHVCTNNESTLYELSSFQYMAACWPFPSSPHTDYIHVSSRGTSCMLHVHTRHMELHIQKRLHVLHTNNYSTSSELAFTHERYRQSAAWIAAGGIKLAWAWACAEQSSMYATLHAFLLVLLTYTYIGMMRNWKT